jgi:hypothetical protein
MAQQPPPEEPAPSWLASPSDYQAPPAPTAYQDWTPASEQQQKPPESFVPIRPTYAELHPRQAAPNDGGFQISFGGYTVTGWHAMVLIGLVLGVWTGIDLYWVVSTNAAFQAYWDAPVCSGAITNSCRADFAANVTYAYAGSSSCEIYFTRQGTDWAGRFPADACRGMGVVDNGARVRLWNGQIVFIQRLDIGHLNQQFWSTDSPVGQHGTASGDILIPLFIDAFYVVALLLALIYRFVNPFRR